MAEIRTVTTLRRKRDEVRKAVRKYERCLDQARADLTHLIAAIAIFEAKGGDESLPAYADLHRLFRYGEAFKLCQQALCSSSHEPASSAFRIVPGHVLPSLSCRPRIGRRGIRGDLAQMR